MKNRMALLPNRRKLTYDNGSVEFAIIEYADQPSEEGTPLSKETFLTDVTATAIGLTADDPTVDDALMALSNRVDDAFMALSNHHASHASGADDAVTPDSIGALSFIDVQSRSSSELMQMRENADLQSPIYGYDGREIPFTWAEIHTKVAAGDFSGIRVGDYKDIVLNGTFYDYAAASNKTLTNETIRMEVAGIDAYINYGDTAVGHHIDFISLDCMSRALKINATDTNSGSFVGSSLFSTLNNATNGLIKLLPSEVSSNVAEKRGLTEVKTSADASSWAWNSLGKLWLPTEREVVGNVAWSEVKWGSGLNVHYSIFKESTRHITKGSGNGGTRCTWILSSTASGSSTQFCVVSASGYVGYLLASSTIAFVPICFRLI